MELERFKQLTVFLNGDLSKSCKVTLREELTIADLVRDCGNTFRLSHIRKYRLFDCTGGELSDEDIEYLDPNQPVFLSFGEDFKKQSSLAIYEKISELGKGGFGTVRLYRHRFTSELIAIKFIDLRSLTNSEDVHRIYKEIGALRSLRHPNIVNLYDTFASGNYICFAMEYCRGGELRQYLEQKGALPEKEVYEIALQICEALRFIHSSGIVHRDLKLENILFATEERKDIKIVDFGISGMCAAGSKGEKSYAGSFYYTAPEVLTRQDVTSNPALDIWSFGCILYALITGQIPFKCDNKHEAGKKIVRAEYEPLPKTVSRPWHRLIKHMIAKRPSKRYNLIRITNHLYNYSTNALTQISESSSEDEQENFNPEQRTRSTRKSGSLIHARLLMPIRNHGRRFQTPLYNSQNKPEGNFQKARTSSISNPRLTSPPKPRPSLLRLQGSTRGRQLK